MEDYAISKEEATLEFPNTENEQSVPEVRNDIETLAEQKRKKKRNKE